MKAVLVLEDGTWYTGESIGVPGETTGEVVFNTCMTGYQEIVTDPSYAGQIVAMTYPLIGNYGFNNEDDESRKPHIEGFIVKELCDAPNNWRYTINANEYFKKNDITGIKGVDTRALTRHIRNCGSMYGIISTECGNIDVLLTKLKTKTAQPRQLVSEVTVKEPVIYQGIGPKITVVDFGVKQNIIRSLLKRDAHTTVLPAGSTFEKIMEQKPDGIVLSNGPGDPTSLGEIIPVIQKLIGTKPILGICLGHQLLGIALGGKTYKLKFGHHGGNHPVKDYITGKCYITSQNHNYALPDNFIDNVVITHRNVNDNTVEGFAVSGIPLISVQYHPEAAPGPVDSGYIFDDFIDMVKKARV